MTDRQKSVLIAAMVCVFAVSALFRARYAQIHHTFIRDIHGNRIDPAHGYFLAATLFALAIYFFVRRSN